MPIKGLTDRGLSFPEIGQIRKGIKETRNRKDGSTYTVPKDLEYFKVDFDERETESIAIFKQVYGEHPTEIRIILPFNEIERMWDPYLEAYTAGRMVARSDGERVLYQLGENGELLVQNGLEVRSGKPKAHPADNVAGKDYQGKPVEYEAVGRLKVIVPELARAAYLTVHTTSVHDIANISDQLRAFYTLNNGQIAGVPLILRRRPKMISTPGDDGKRVRREKWLLSIEADPQWVKAKLQEVKRLALPGNGLALPPAMDEPEEGPLPFDQLGITDGQYAETKPDGEYHEEQKQQPPAKPTNGKHAERPYSPEVLANKLNEKATGYNGKPVSPQQRGLFVGMMAAVFAGDDDKRHTVQEYLFGAPSGYEIPDELILAGLDWLKPTKDTGGAYLPDAMAVKEAQAVWDASLVQEGQQELL